MSRPLGAGALPAEAIGRAASLTVVMPALDEQANIEDSIRSVLAGFERHGIDGELVVVNDGSRDGTAKIAEKLKASDPRIRVIHHDAPRGVGAAFWEGAQIAAKEFVTMIPGDNENNPDEVLLYLYLARDVDIIVPFVANVEVRSKSRRLLSSLYRLIVNLSFGTNLNYTNGTVAYRSCLLKGIQLSSKGFFYQTELLVRLIRAGYLFAEVPHFLQKRQTGRTKALTLKSFFFVVRSYLKLFSDVHLARSIGQSNLRLHPESATARRTVSLTSSELSR